MSLFHDVVPNGDIILLLFSYHPKYEDISAKPLEDPNDKIAPSPFSPFPDEDPPPNEDEDVSDDELPPPKSIRQTVRIRVSSSKLSGFPAFIMLLEDKLPPEQRTWNPDRPGFDGTTEVHLKHDDPTAMLLLMKILHEKFDQVPNVDSNTLWELAILLGKYNLRNDYLKVCYTEWRRKGLNLQGQDVTGAMLYFCLSWLFEDEYMFYDLSKQLVLESRSRLRTDLPIPGYILDRIDEQRHRLLETLTSQLNHYRSLFQGDGVESTYKDPCEPECDARVRNGVTRGLISLGLHPFPDPPYDGLSLDDIVTRIRDMPVPTLHRASQSINKWVVSTEPIFHLGSENRKIAPICDAWSSLEKALRTAVGNCEGLWLGDVANY